MKITLFEAAAQVRETMNTAIDEATGELSLAYVESRALFEQKAEGCIAWLLEENAALHAAEQLLEHMQEKLKTRKTRWDKFQQYIRENMKASGISEIKHPHGLFKAKLYLNRDESVELDADANIPAELCNSPKPPQPSKSKIKAAIKSGQAIEGARLVQRDRLSIT